MKSLALVFLLISCAQQPPGPFVKEQVCAPRALAFIHKSLSTGRQLCTSNALHAQLQQALPQLQQCYKDFLKRTGRGDFQTCLVVGVDGRGEVDYFNFSAQDVQEDEEFLNCGIAATGRIPFGSYGRSYVLLQTYNFYRE